MGDSPINNDAACHITLGLLIENPILLELLVSEVISILIHLVRQSV